MAQALLYTSQTGPENVVNALAALAGWELGLTFASLLNFQFCHHNKNLILTCELGKNVLVPAACFGSRKLVRPPGM